jgi:hypothetical protein
LSTQILLAIVDHMARTTVSRQFGRVEPAEGGGSERGIIINKKVLGKRSRQTTH